MNKKKKPKTEEEWDAFRKAHKSPWESILLLQDELALVCRQLDTLWSYLDRNFPRVSQIAREAPAVIKPEPDKEMQDRAKLTTITNRQLRMKAFPRVECSRGAPKGRMSVIPSEKTIEPFELHLVRSKWVDYDYDEGGAYWGFSKGSHIYCGYHPSGIRIYARAGGVSDAADRILDACPPNTVTF